MKQTKPSNTIVQTNTADSQSERAPNPQPRTARYNKRMKGVLAMLCLALLVTVYVLAHRSFSSRTSATNPVPLSISRTLEVEVLDGAGSMKAAQGMMNVLRSLGYNVVEMKRNNEGIVERTYVIDRSGNLDAARRLAKDIGISEDKVFQKINRNLYLDVTVMVGKDFSQLKAFQLFTKRSKH
jgi:hypothetical protein